MTKKTAIVLISFLFPVLMFTQDAGVKWFKGDINKAMDTAKKENKIIFIDFYADWCSPCKMLDKMVWQDADAAKRIKTMNVIPMKLDAEKEGAEAAKKYSVKAYPTILFIDNNGKEISRTAGFRDKESVIQMIKKNCDDPRSMESLRAAREKDPDDMALAATIVKKLIAAGTEEGAEEAKALLEKIYKSDPDNKKGFGAQALIDRLAIGLGELDDSARWLKYLDVIKKGFSDDIVVLWDEEPLKLKDLGTAVKMFSSGAKKQFAESAEPVLKNVLIRVETLKNADVDISKLMEFEDFYIKAADNPDLRELSNLYFDIIGCFAKDADANTLNEIAWHNYTVQRKLEESAALAKKSAELNRDPNALDTLAHIFMSMGMKEKAVETEKEAIEYLKKAGDSKKAEIFSQELSLFEKNQLDQLAPGVEPQNRELRRAEE